MRRGGYWISEPQVSTIRVCYLRGLRVSRREAQALAASTRHQPPDWASTSQPMRPSPSLPTLSAPPCSLGPSCTSASPLVFPLCCHPCQTAVFSAPLWILLGLNSVSVWGLAQPASFLVSVPHSLCSPFFLLASVFCPCLSSSVPMLFATELPFLLSLVWSLLVSATRTNLPQPTPPNKEANIHANVNRRKTETHEAPNLHKELQAPKE